jgi:hypothetical protein
MARRTTECPEPPTDVSLEWSLEDLPKALDVYAGFDVETPDAHFCASRDPWFSLILNKRINEF